MRGGLSVTDYLKVISVQQLQRAALAAARARRHDAGARRRPGSARPLRGGAAWPNETAQGRDPPAPAVQTMAPYSPPTGGRAGKLRLDFNENTVGCSPRVIEALQERASARDNLAVYPEYGEAKEAVARYFDVTPAQFVFTNGTDEAIQVFVNTYVDDGQEVVLLKPAYAMYRFYAEVAGAKISESRLPRRRWNFRSRPCSTPSPRRRAPCCSPIPTTPPAPRSRSMASSAFCKRARKAVVLIDEAYYEFSGVTALTEIETRAQSVRLPHVFEGLRHGRDAARLPVFASRPTSRYLHKAQSPYSVNALAVLAAQAAVEDRAYIENYVAEVLAARELLCVGLEKLGIGYVPSSANFVLGRLRQARHRSARRPARRTASWCATAATKPRAASASPSARASRRAACWPRWRRSGSNEQAPAGLRHGWRPGGRDRILPRDHRAHRGAFHRATPSQRAAFRTTRTRAAGTTTGSSRTT